MVYILLMLFTALNRLVVFLAEAVSRSVQGQTLSTLDSYLWGMPFAAGPAMEMAMPDSKKIPAPIIVPAPMLSAAQNPRSRRKCSV